MRRLACMGWPLSHDHSSTSSCMLHAWGSSRWCSLYGVSSRQKRLYNNLYAHRHMLLRWSCLACRSKQASQQAGSFSCCCSTTEVSNRCTSCGRLEPTVKAVQDISKYFTALVDNLGYYYIFACSSTAPRVSGTATGGGGARQRCCLAKSEEMHSMKPEVGCAAITRPFVSTLHTQKS